MIRSIQIALVFKGKPPLCTDCVADVLPHQQRLDIIHKTFFPCRCRYEHIFSDHAARAAAEARGFLQKTLPADNIPLLLKQDAIRCAQKIRVPALIVQGEKDAVVQHTSVRTVYEALAAEKELYVVEGSGHSFATDWKGAQAFDHIANWMEKHLKTMEGERSMKGES